MKNLAKKQLKTYVLGAAIALAVPALATAASDTVTQTKTAQGQSHKMHSHSEHIKQGPKRPWYEHFERGRAHAKGDAANPPSRGALSEEQKAAMQARFVKISEQQFAHFDLNKDGYITQEEVTEVMVAKAQARAAKLFQDMDNGTGQVDQAAFQQYLQEKRMQRTEFRRPPAPPKPVGHSTQHGRQ